MEMILCYKQVVMCLIIACAVIWTSSADLDQVTPTVMIGNNSNISCPISPNNTCQLNTMKVHHPLFLFGTCVSITTCLAAFFVYIMIRDKIFRTTAQLLDRDDTKHWIHCNFILSFLIRDFAIVFVVSHVIQIKEIPGFSGVGIYFYLFTIIANFYWMFAEGLWLYFGVSLPNDFKKFRFMKTKMCLVGWWLPVSLVSVYAIIKETEKLRQNNVQMDDCNSPNPFWELPAIFCILIPVYFVVLLNLMMMIRVLLHFGYLLRREMKTKRRLVRATLILSFLLGMNFAIPFIILPSLPENEKCAFEVVMTVSDTVSSLQGFFVALFYVLRNAEVLQYLETEIPFELPSSISPRASRGSRTSHSSDTRQVRTSRSSGNNVSNARSDSNANQELETTSFLGSPPGDDHNTNANGKPSMNNGNHGNHVVMVETEQHTPI
ncbi:corticotropin-releasing factor receptor 1-like [Amphiura filiformis]|uniref:corticotropin-releasing factor receptor 1-like n=1 Tax=Amphiura filiformis TaxID=82378 RepID=UPI003B21A19B